MQWFLLPFDLSREKVIDVDGHLRCKVCCRAVNPAMALGPTYENSIFCKQKKCNLRHELLLDAPSSGLYVPAARAGGALCGFGTNGVRLCRVQEACAPGHSSNVMLAEAAPTLAQ